MGTGDVTGGVGARPEGFRDAGGGIGGFLPNGGGLGLNEPPLSEEEVVDVVSVETIDVGRRLFLKAATERTEADAPGGRGGAEPGTRRGAPGGLGTEGAEAIGGRGTVLFVVSGSDRYGELLSAPVATPPPVFRSFGMPPARMPANCGGPADDPPPPSPPPSLLLLARFGGGGARLPREGRFGSPPGTGGAPPIGAAGPSDFLSIIGADLSFICATFFNLAPCSMLLKSAPCELSAA